jgi:Holliday junction resolvasome RuvABC endonuclease subunit
MTLGRYKLVTAVYLNARGFAFALFEGQLAPLDWGVFEARGRNKEERILSRVDDLFSRYRPDVVVLQDTSSNNAHQPERICRLNAAISEIAEQYGFSIVFFSRADVRQRFGYLGIATKDTIAAAIAKHIPAFERFLPPPRKLWKSEDARMGIFDAAALALTFFEERSNEGRIST